MAYDDDMTHRKGSRERQVEEKMKKLDKETTGVAPWTRIEKIATARNRGDFNPDNYQADKDVWNM